LSCCSDSGIRIPGGRAASGAARAAATVELGDELDDERMRDLQLLLSEVVNNSVVHGDVDEDGWIEITLAMDDDHIRCEVRDSSLQGDPAPREPDFESGGGFGLFLVEAMASRWGTDRDPTLTVWFELDRAG